MTYLERAFQTIAAAGSQPDDQMQGREGRELLGFLSEQVKLRGNARIGEYLSASKPDKHKDASEGVRMLAKRVATRWGLAVTALLAVILLIGIRSLAGPWEQKSVARAKLAGAQNSANPEAIASSMTFYAVADATVKSAQPNTNFGYEHYLEVSYNTIEGAAEEIILVRFDLSGLPAGAVIDSAVMELFLEYAAGDNPKSLAAYPVTSAWAENTVAWSTFPTADTWGVVSSVDNATGRYKAWTISSWVTYWQSNPAQNHGVYLRRPTAETTYFERVFESKDHNENRPRLVVSYHIPTPTPTPTTTTATQTQTSTPTGIPTATSTPTETPTSTPTSTRVAETPSPTPTPTTTSTAVPTSTPTSAPTSVPTLTTITFEEAIPNPESVRTQYCNNPATNKGVEFLHQDRIFQPSVQTSSGTRALTNVYPGQEFGHANTVAIRFTAGQSLVSVKVGLDRSYAYPIVAVMYAYSSSTPGTGFLTYDTRYLGNGPSPITQDLTVSSAAGAIRSVVITFESATPNYYAHEVLDDLTFTTIGPPCITDTAAPTVQITEPVAEGQIFQTPSLGLAFAANDVGSGVARIQVSFLNVGGSELGSFYVCGAPGAPTCLYDVVPYTASYNFLTFMPSNTAKIRVRAWDFTGQTGHADRAVNYVDIGHFNLWAQAIEITQGVQPWRPVSSQTRLSTTPPTFQYASAPTSVPLVADRTTVVRIYAGVEGTTGNQPLEKVRAQLRCFSNSSYTLPCPGYQAINPQNLPPGVLSQIVVRPGDSLDTKQKDAKLSWNFVLPHSWTTVGTVYLEGVILPPIGLQECTGCDDAANRIRLSNVKFESVPALTSLVHFVRVRRQLDDETFEPTEAQMTAHVDCLRPLYPASEATLHTGPNTTWIYDDCGDKCDPDPKKNLSVRCEHLYHQLVKAFPDRANKLALYALVDSAFPCSGRGGNGYSYGGALATNSFPHEVGHAVGLNHPGPPPGHAAECAVLSWCDTDWPWPHGTLGAFGFDVFKMNVVVPGTTEADPHDFMSYGGPTKWVSSRTWTRIFNAFTGQNLPYPKADALNVTSVERAVDPAGALHAHLMVSGQLTGAGNWILSPAYELHYPITTDDEPGEGDYSIALCGAAGEDLLVRRFSLSVGHIDTFDLSELAAPLGFTQLLPLPEGMMTIELRQGAATLAVAARSPHAPTVEILSPTSVGFAGQPDAPHIRWTGHDVDGDGLTYMVRYRPNAEAEWQTLATDWTVTELAVNLDDLPGGNAAMVQVLATDGLNTGATTSPAFVVPGKQPQVQVLMPAGTTSIQEGDRLILRGAASDVEDGLLGDAALTWSSDRDGQLGTGPWIETTTLSLGSHSLTLAARDGSGQMGTATTIVEVAQRPNSQPIADAGPDRMSGSGCSVVLDGSRSADPDGDRLVFVWSVMSQPERSKAWFSDSEAPRTWFFTDRGGDYEVELNVHDGRVGGQADRAAIRVIGTGADHRCLYLPTLMRRLP